MKNVTILILGLLVSQISFAQQEFRFGLKGAANIGWVTEGSRNITSNGATLGWAYGLMGDYYFQPNYALSFEVLLSQVKGGFIHNDSLTFINEPGAGAYTGLTYDYNKQFLEIPVSIKFRTKEIGNITYWANFGFSPGILTQSKATLSHASGLPASIIAADPVEYRTNDDEGDPFTVDKFDDQAGLFRLPLIVGGGIEYGLAGKTSLYTGVRFTNNFVDGLTKDKEVNAKFNYFSINVGVFF